MIVAPSVIPTTRNNGCCHQTRGQTSSDSATAARHASTVSSGERRPRIQARTGASRRCARGMVIEIVSALVAHVQKSTARNSPELMSM